MNVPSTPNPISSEAVCSDYLLVCQAQSIELNQGNWRFTLESASGELILEASDDDLGDLNRLTLLATVRGLESIEGASRVTLLSTNRYLIRSLSDSLPRWRENNFVWEHFGRRIDVQHADLWRRVDRALSIHRVEACLVSSRLVSTVAAPSVHRTLEPSESFAGASNTATDGATHLRIDQGHVGVPTRRVDAGPKDQLRRWLLGTAASSESNTARRRFSAADLCQT
ncbi:ribonuclease HI [Rubripirellula tenax]|uniref:ribonuclease HI n=1 Tax=Rubripirellula tenax TaxID=2528015 RepID=UPI0011B499E0|nr:ribonuclease HI [Rubripirellula tenax]